MYYIDIASQSEEAIPIKIFLLKAVIETLENGENYVQS